MRLATGSTANWFQSWSTAAEDADGQANYLWASGSWTVSGIDTSTTTPTDQQMKAQPIYIDRRVTIDRLGIYVTGAGTAGAVARAGIYAHDATSALPGALVLNGGSDQATTSTGVITWTVSTTLEPGIYWVAVLPHGAPATPATFQSAPRSAFTIAVPAASSATAFTSGVTGITKGSAGTSLPNPFGTPTAYGNNLPRIGLRVA